MADENIARPDWRHAHRKLVEIFEREMLRERDAGEANVRLSAEKIRELARWKATQSIEQAIRLYDSPEAVLARKRKTQQAA